MSKNLPALLAVALGLALSTATVLPASAEPDEGAPGQILSPREARSLQISPREQAAAKRDDGRYLQLVSDGDTTPAPPLGRTPAVRPGAQATVEAAAPAQPGR